MAREPLPTFRIRVALLYPSLILEASDFMFMMGRSLVAQRLGVRRRREDESENVAVDRRHLVWAAGSSAYADCQTTVFDRSGAWRAFGGKCDDGRQKCGVSTSGTGKYFSIDYFNGDNTLTVQLGSSDWRVNNGDKTRVTMQIDSAAAVARHRHGDAFFRW